MPATRKNLVGPQVRKLRYQFGWRQKDLAAKLQILGWDIDRAGVSKIESRFVCVCDLEMVYLAKVLRVQMMDLFPPIDPSLGPRESILRLKKL